ncbi:neutral/alkaline ceramidase [Chengkuizengella axinellae]|uniref:Neutral ceramidase n=1 Tax=Chengkuizengella axinellae TaxID=3064388 RepID=A0ABT9IZT7_9BACL|nr:neutral/alkaline non-lysosomal ceramidase N-terminal domain-containing protein [Chengkuizengella sp. 2205SS18-9]MDP5274290.1 neutral/alkaline non-lysosomal ceramidase N-terminal domain-containing protein [Chengkuizengella sp. 2205SS18-9]
MKMYYSHKKATIGLLALLFLFSYVLSPNDVSVYAEGDFDYYIGTGIYDITGPPAEVVMMGYANSSMMTEGLHFRLKSRAFIMKEKDSDNSLVFVSADTGMIFHSITQGVIQKLEDNGYGDLYNYNNVMLSATHNHSGPGGYSHEGLYNVSSYGFHEENYEVIVDGIYESIVRAHENLEPGYIEINQGQVDGTSSNRSKEAYNNNPEAERNQYDDNVDKTMTLLNFKNSEGDLLGVINWFAVHGVSMGQDNDLISGENKGYASYLYEKEMETDYHAEKTFVAAFSQSNLGDVTPNIFGDGDGYGDNDFESTQESGRIQFEAAIHLSETANERLKGPLSSKHQFKDFSNIEIDGQYTDGETQRTYPSALGYSFAAGTEDGRPGLPVFEEGMTQAEYSLEDHHNIVKFVQDLMVIVPQIGEMSGSLYPELWEQHFPKPVLFAPSQVEPDPWTPQIIPQQIFQLGQLSVIAVPAEFTTMAGRRLGDLVITNMADQFNDDNYAVIAGLSNSYSSYVSTPEEYDMQHYEGASTQFGRWTLSAYLQEFDKLSNAIILDEEIDPGPTPKDLTDEQVYFLPGIVFDAPPAFRDFGDIKDDVNSNYKASDIVKVTFWSGHPNNNFRNDSTYLEVQQLIDGEWKVIADDHDWETKFYWDRESTLLGTSSSTIEWEVPEDADSGTYRIVHYGAYQKITGKVFEYTGKSSEFTVE